MDNPEAWERGQADHDAADGKEEAKGEGREDGVRGDDHLAAVGILGEIASSKAVLTVTAIAAAGAATEGGRARVGA